MKRLLILLFFLVIITRSFPQIPKKGEVVSLNNRSIYYEVYGKGEPLLLLHGYGQSSKYWLPYLSNYSENFEVYVVDLLGHGKSSPFKEKLSIKTAANDVQALIRYLKLDSVKGIGFSYGGDVLIQLALLQPALVKSIISIGACGSWNAKDYPEVIEFFSYKNIANLNLTDYQMNEAQSKGILDQLPNYIVSLNEEELKKIQAKILFVLGDHDVLVPLDCITQARRHLRESYLWIIPNSEHGAHEGKNEQEFVKVSKQFLKEKWKE